jgi:hypothetical protein
VRHGAAVVRKRREDAGQCADCDGDVFVLFVYGVQVKIAYLEYREKEKIAKAIGSKDKVLCILPWPVHFIRAFR